MMSSGSSDPQQQAMSQTMELMMPMMFGFITLQLASGLGLYFVATNVFGIIIQYFVSGWGSLAAVLGRSGSRPRTRTNGGKNGRKK
jgi:YidC/Oxa1 family membrane protein insertase